MPETMLTDHKKKNTKKDFKITEPYHLCILIHSNRSAERAGVEIEKVEREKSQISYP